MALGQPSRLARPEQLTRSIPAMLASDSPSVSFEFFPPKDDAAEALLWDAIRRLESVRPDFVSVTYGAGGSNQDRTVRVTERIARETTLTPLAHLTCVDASVAALRQVVGMYAAAGVRNILALRGDPPGNPGGEWVPHPEGLNHATDLVSLVRSLGDFTIGVAAFPDVHPSSPDLAHDVEVMVRKADAGASFAITQMVFDADSYLRLRDLVAARRDLPITPGLMPVTNFKQVARMSQLMGTPLPPPVISRLEAVSGDLVATREVGVQIATELGERMLAEGAPGLHFITMNRSTATLEVHRNLGLSAPATERVGAGPGTSSPRRA
jgi:methylenetetrahydrofolate reductase (NADPH)